MKRLILAILSASVLMFATSNVMADGLKIGVIDLQQIMQKSTQVAAINSQLNKEFQPRQAKIIAAQKNLQNEIDQLNRNSTTMNDADRNKLQDQIVTDRTTVQDTMMAFQRDVSTAQNQALKTFMTQLTGVVNNIAQANHYDLILQRAGVPYVSSNLDITEQVVEALNKKS